MNGLLDIKADISCIICSCLADVLISYDSLDRVMILYRMLLMQDRSMVYMYSFMKDVNRCLVWKIARLPDDWVFVCNLSKGYGRLLSFRGSVLTPRSCIVIRHLIVSQILDYRSYFVWFLSVIGVCVYCASARICVHKIHLDNVLCAAALYERHIDPAKYTGSII